MKPAPLKFHFERFEFKYQIPLDLVEGIVPEILKYMDWDPFAENLPDQAYKVSSLYYDSAGLDCYYQKLAGLEYRKKFRLRFYEPVIRPETLIFLELKRKDDAVVVKDRLALPYQQCCDILLDMRNIPRLIAPDQKKALDEFIWAVRYNGMRPQVLVSYRRKPLVGKIDPQFRVTIDYQIETRMMSWFNDAS